MKLRSLTTRALAIVVPCLLNVAAGSQEPLPALEGHATFDWFAPTLPAVLSFPLPKEQELALEELAFASIPGRVRIQSVTFSAEPRDVQLTVLPTTEQETSFDAIELQLVTGETLPYLIGAARLLPVEQVHGPLDFQRSIRAPAGGLLLAALLRNNSAKEVSLTRVDYLPGVFPAGELLVWVGTNAQEQIDRLDQIFTPGMQWERERSQALGETAAAPSGFRWILPEFPEIALAPNEAALLLWTPQAFSASATPEEYRLRPVVSYRVAGESSEYRLGLPETLRSSP